MIQNQWYDSNALHILSTDFIPKQGRVHGNPVADGWAGAVMQKPLEIQQGQIHGCRYRVRLGRGSDEKY